MLNEKRLLTGGMLAALAAVWALVALVTPHGFVDLVSYIGPAAVLAVAVAWLFFTFAGNLFTWPRAVVSVLLGAAVLSPVLAYFFSESKDQDLIEKFFFMVAVGWAASLGGILWNLGGAASDALKEWRTERKMRQPRRVFVPV
jgi:hypothetical protein